MELFALQCFVEVVRAESFSRAADRVFRTQPAVSLQVRKLEREVGRQLIDRSRKRAVPTEAGRLLYERARALLEELGSLERLVGKADREPSGRLAIASNLALIDHVLPGPLGAFHRRYPRVQIALFNRRSEEILRLLIDGAAEVGVGYLAPRNRQIDRERLGEARFLLVEPRGVERPRPPLARELGTKGLLHFERGVELRRYLERHLALRSAVDAGPEPAMELPSMATILRYVQSGFGYSILPEFGVPSGARVAATPLAGMLPPLPVEAYTVRGRQLSPAAEAWLAMLRRSPLRGLARPGGDARG